MQNATKPVIFFDGICNLCNRYVQFVIKHDKKGVFLFAPLQSMTGQKATQTIKATQGDVPDSIVVLSAGKYFYKSDAVFEILGRLGGLWPLLLAGKVFPRFFRNKAYDWVARNRYNWFGKKDTCMVPTPQLQQRFLSS